MRVVCAALCIHVYYKEGQQWWHSTYILHTSHIIVCHIHGVIHVLLNINIIFPVWIYWIAVAVSNRNVINTSQCSTHQWQCENGQCIDSSEACDGVRNCRLVSNEIYKFGNRFNMPFAESLKKLYYRDGSDETTENCIATTCPKYAFRCMYGACVSGNYSSGHFDYYSRIFFVTIWIWFYFISNR